MKEKIRKILKENLYADLKIYYPTAKDLERNPNMLPCDEKVVRGINKSVNQIMDLIEKEVKKECMKDIVLNAKEK